MRAPLGQRLEREELNEENAGLLSAWDGEECVGTMVLLEEDPQSSRMKAVAVAANK